MDQLIVGCRISTSGIKGIVTAKWPWRNRFRKIQCNMRLQQKMLISSFQREYLFSDCKISCVTWYSSKKQRKQVNAIRVSSLKGKSSDTANIMTRHLQYIKVHTCKHWQRWKNYFWFLFEFCLWFKKNRSIAMKMCGKFFAGLWTHQQLVLNHFLKMTCGQNDFTLLDLFWANKQMKESSPSILLLYQTQNRFQWNIDNAWVSTRNGITSE